MSDPTPNRLAILKDNPSPPGGWRFTVPETGHVVTGSYAKQVKQRALEHMAANSVPIPPDYDEWVEDAMCRENNHGQPWCGKPRAKPVAGRAKVLTLGSAKRFLMTVLHAIRAHRFVSTEEALRRAAICAECPLAGDIGGCKKGCSAIFKTVSRAIGENPVEEFLKDKKNERGEKLVFCLACSCFLAAKPFLPNDVLDKAEVGDRPEYWKDKCWRLPENAV